MTIDYERLKQWPFLEHVQTYAQRDTQLYALSLGLGNDPLDPRSLPFVYEGSPGGLRVLPTMAAVLGYPGFWARDPDSGIDWVKLVHGEQRLRVFKPLPATATVRSHNRITHVIDKGAGKGAIVIIERQLLDEQGELLATLQQVNFCRGDGGYSANGQPSDAPLPALPATPDSEPAVTDLQATRPEIALIYRLLADDNPLHADPAVAAKAGYPRPILHGLATYGLAASAIVRHCCRGDPTRLRTLDVRFCGPMYPGETLQTEIWHRDGIVQFRALAVERNQLVLSNGRAGIA